MSTTEARRSTRGMSIPVQSVHAINWSQPRGEVLKKLRFGRSREACVRRMAESCDEPISRRLWEKIEYAEGVKTVPVETLRKIALGLSTPIQEISLDRLLDELLAVN